ncbi:hypothetical protein ABZ930_30465 [Streptomyces sp. NPDC046716]|uniref:fascin domain-containing protein n=1 Tax=Streptomyces sp. NPDC046716 TaxID=3157093 RepID=UPI0033F40032
MRRTTSVLLSLSALVAVTGLTVPAAVAAPVGERAAVPAGWEAVDAADLARVTAGTDGRRAPRAAAEPERLALQSARNNRFVATEVSYPAPNTGAQRARSTAVGGSWESYAFEWDEATATYALRSLANNRYVAVEKNYTGSAKNILRARSTSAGSWERFALYYNADLDRYALQSTLNGLFVTMENSYTGSLQYVLRARSAEVSGSWEQFALYSIDA